MMARQRTLYEILEDHELGLKQMRAALTRIGSGGVTDHGGLTGLGDDDHPQYAKLAGDTFTGAVFMNAKAKVGGSSWTQEPWSSATMELGNFGAIGTQGSYRLDLAWNWERGIDSGYYSKSVNSYTEAARISMGNSGIVFGFDSTYGATTIPTKRLQITESIQADTYFKIAYDHTTTPGLEIEGGEAGNYWAGKVRFSTNEGAEFYDMGMRGASDSSGGLDFLWEYYNGSSYLPIVRYDVSTRTLDFGEPIRIDNAGASPAYGQLVLGQGTEDAIFRNDGNRMYFLIGSSAEATWNTLRPLSWDLTTGLVYLDGTNVGVRIGSGQSFTINDGNGNNRVAGSSSYTNLYNPSGATRIWVGINDYWQNATNHYFRDTSSRTRMELDANGLVVYGEDPYTNGRAIIHANSAATGGNNDDQRAIVSCGESPILSGTGKGGLAYAGDGYLWIGMGSVGGTTGIWSQPYIRMYYNSINMWQDWTNFTVDSYYNATAYGNVRITAHTGGRITQNSYSSLRAYKREIKTHKVEQSPFLKFRPVTYRYNDNPRLDFIDELDRDRLRHGYILDEALEAGMCEDYVEHHPEDLKPHGIYYDAFMEDLVTDHTALVQDHLSLKREVKKLRKKLEALTA